MGVVLLGVRDETVRHQAIQRCTTGENEGKYVVKVPEDPV
jgi:hypothetical protein